MQTVAPTEIPARWWEPKRAQLRLLSIAGKIVRHARGVRCIWGHCQEVDVLVASPNRLAALPAPA